MHALTLMTQPVLKTVGVSALYSVSFRYRLIQWCKWCWGLQELPHFTVYESVYYPYHIILSFTITCLSRKKIILRTFKFFLNFKIAWYRFGEVLRLLLCVWVKSVLETSRFLAINKVHCCLLFIARPSVPPLQFINNTYILHHTPSKLWSHRLQRHR